MKSYTIKSYAKVNVGLQILNQRPDGYHNINTVFQELDFYDTIELKKKDKGCEFQSNVNWLIKHYSKHFGISLKEINTVPRFNKAFIENLQLLEVVC